MYVMITWGSTGLFRQIYLKSTNVLWVTDPEMGCEFCKASWRLVGFCCTVLLVTGPNWEVINHISSLDFYPCVTKVLFQVGYNLVSPCSCLSKPFWFFFSMSLNYKLHSKTFLTYLCFVLLRYSLTYSWRSWIFFCMIMQLCIWIYSCIV